MNLKIDTTEHDAYYEINVAGELDVATVPIARSFNSNQTARDT